MSYLDKHVGLYTDQYELTMAQAHFLQGRQEIEAIFDYFFRRTPFDGSYTVFAGLQDVLETLEKFRYDETDLRYLQSTGFHPDFLDYLSNFRFSGEVYAPPEGSLVFAGEPVVRVEGPIIETQVIETLVLNILNFQSLIATKAARLRLAAGTDRKVIDFGLRRAQGLGGIHASRAAVIGGLQSTSNVYAGRLFDIPASGTQAHAWIQSYDDEYRSFADFAEVFPKKCILLVDTYDTLKSGVPNAIAVAKEMESKGRKLFGIRLDSGDHVHFSKKAREMLDDAGLDYVKIVASNELDEHVIEDILARGAPIDGFGVGTNLVTGRDDAALDGVYKLCKSGGKPRLKLSENEAKIINPDRKNVIRYYKDQQLYGDGICLQSEDPENIVTLYNSDNDDFDVGGLDREVVLGKVMDDGVSRVGRRSIDDIADHVRKGLAALPERFKVLRQGPDFPVGVSKSLMELRSRLIEEAKNKYKQSQ